MPPVDTAIVSNPKAPKRSRSAAPSAPQTSETSTPTLAPAPGAPTPAPQVEPPTAETPKVYNLVAAELPFAILQNLSVLIVDGLAKDFAKKNTRVKEVRDDYKDAAKAAAKVYAVLEIRLNKGKEMNLFAQTKSLGEYIKDITGEKPPTHALTLKNAFSGYVMSSLIEEAAFDANSGNCLELAARILTECKGELAHGAVAQAAEQLKLRTDKEAKNLRDILASVKPAEKLSAEDALEMFERISAEGHLGMALAHVPDLLADMAEKDQRENYIALAHALEAVDKKLGDKVDAWTRDASSAIQITAGGTDTGRVIETAALETATA
jgi:hypothetical protein